MLSTVEVEIGAAYMNANKAGHEWNILYNLGQHTLIINSTNQLKCMCKMSMWLHWIHDKEAQGQFKFTQK